MQTSTPRLILVAWKSEIPTLKNSVSHLHALHASRQYDNEVAKRYHLFQTQLLLHNGRVTDIKDDIVVVNVLANNVICLWYCVVASIRFIMRAWKGVVFKIAFAGDLKANLIRYHSMWPEVLICCRNIPIQFEKWVSDLILKTDVRPYLE